MTTTPGGDGSEPPPPDAPLQYRDIVDALKGQDERWEIQQAPGYLAMAREWGNGDVDQMSVFGPHTAYASRETKDGDLIWEKRATPQEVLKAVLALQDAGEVDRPMSPDPSKPRGNWR